MQGKPTDGYIKYIMKYVNLLLQQNIKPILVFDGRNLPSKVGHGPNLASGVQLLINQAETEKKRRTARREAREKAVQLVRVTVLRWSVVLHCTVQMAEGRAGEARDYFQRCVDITPAMARNVIEVSTDLLADWHTAGRRHTP